MKNSIALIRVLGTVAVIVVALGAVGVALAATQLLVNGSFNTDFTADSSWAIDTAGGGSVVYNNGIGNPTLGAVQIDVDNSSGQLYAEVYQCVNVSGLPVPPTYISVTAQFNASANVNGYINVDSFGGNGCTGQTGNAFTSAPGTPGTGDWQTLQTDSVDVTLTDAGLITPVRSLKVTLGAIDLAGLGPESVYFDEASAFAAADNGTPNAVTLNRLDAKQPIELAAIWPLLIALPLALGAGVLVLRRRRA